MKIGPLHLAWRTSQQSRDAEAALLDYLATDEHPRAIVARMARSEVKNYLAEVAEAAEVPYFGATGFVRDVVSGALDRE